MSTDRDIAYQSKVPTAEKQARFLSWLGIPPEKRKPATKVELALELNVHPNTLDNWEKNPKIPDTLEEGEAKRLLKGLLEAGIQGNAQAGRIWLLAKGRLVEKSEHKISFDAGQVTREILRAERELDEVGSGVEEVQERTPLLLTDVLQDTGQSQEEDS